MLDELFEAIFERKERRRSRAEEDADDDDGERWSRHRGRPSRRSHGERGWAKGREDRGDGQPYAERKRKRWWERLGDLLEFGD